MSRSSLLLALTCLSLCACSERVEERGLRTASLVVGESAAPRPEDLAHSFLAAVRDRDEASFERLLTEKARATMRSGENGFSLSDQAVDDFEVGLTSVDGDEASVSATTVTAGEEQDVRLRMRREGPAWRVWGIDLVVGDGGELTLDFEELGSMVEMVEAELAGALQEAFSQVSMGGSPEEIRLQRDRFDRLAAISRREYEAAWRMDLAVEDRPAADVLEELVADTGVSIAPGAFAERLAGRITLKASGLSRVQAIERICRELDLSPVYPEANSWQKSPLELGFESGARPRPVAFAGPFLVEVTDLVENVPHATGSITIAVRALGISPTALDFQRDGAVELLAVDEIVDAAGNNLNGDDGVQFLGTPHAGDGYLSDSTTLDLRNLLRGAVSIARVSGSLHLDFPTEVRATTWERERTQPKQVDGMTLSLQSWDAYTQFELESSSKDLEGLQVRLSGVDASGEPLGTLLADSSGWGNKLYPSLQTPEPPAAIDLKICRVEEAEYEFTLEGIPLLRHAEMPERLEPLGFAGEGPVVVEFVRFTGRDEQFPEVELRILNESNKDAVQVLATFVYLDGEGEPLEDFPHTLSGPFSFEGQEPLVLQGASTVESTTAFFMPTETASLRVRVDEVSFADATTWTRED